MAFVNLMTLAYPVGSYYITKSATNPASKFGGTWVEIAAGAFLRAVGSGGTSTSDPTTVAGGEATVTLTVDQMPSHKHAYGYYYWNQVPNNGTTYLEDQWLAGADTRVDGSYNGTRSTGGGAAHNNLPPYVNVHIFYRSA